MSIFNQIFSLAFIKRLIKKLLIQNVLFLSFLLFQFVKEGLVVKCQVHDVKKIERWVAQHGGGKDDKTILKADFRHLIRSESLNEYHQRQSQVITRWSQAYMLRTVCDIYRQRS